MIDIHTHILPEIDDGSQSSSETLDMITEAYDAGFTDIITTSHFITGRFEVNKIERTLIISALQKKVDADGIDLKLYNGAESYITPELIDYYENNSIPTLAGSRYALFEFPMNSKVLYGDKVIDDLLDNGYIPVIAHPERYSVVQKDLEIANHWIEKGALLQSNYGSILEQYGKNAKKTFIKLLKERKITFLGSDCHARKSVYTRVNRAVNEMEKYADMDYIDKITRLNQEKVIEDKEIF